MRPLIVLVGAPGSGKSTVGRLLAQRQGLPFRDTDADVEATQGTTVADIFAVAGEAAFRECERAAVSAALQDHPGVLALGGGAVLDERTRSDLRTAAASGATVVWLQVSAAAAARRVGLGVSRPLLLGNVRARLVDLLAQREPLYREVATVIIDSDEVDSAEAAVSAIVAAIGDGGHDRREAG